MEYVYIITKEAITRGLVWPTVVIGTIAILIMFIYNIIVVIRKDENLCVRVYIIVFVLLFIMLLSPLVCNRWFTIDTGRYKYTATLAPEMTIVEFEKFQETYANITYKDGVWHFEDKEN